MLAAVAVWVSILPSSLDFILRRSVPSKGAKPAVHHRSKREPSPDLGWNLVQLDGGRKCGRGSREGDTGCGISQDSGV